MKRQLFQQTKRNAGKMSVALALLALATPTVTQAAGLATSSSQWVQAEEAITGKITDAKGEALPGVGIAIKKTTRGTTTDVNGMFKINANVGDVLVISFVGFTTKEVKVTGPTVNVVLEESLSTLDEIVVTGTRTSGRTKVDTPVPVDIIPLAQVTNTIGQVDINQILTFIAPSF
ncbi:MAG: carboxypeptidase-like regulatory domain-containing protein, partial [Spirosomataceae bacterium]